MRAHELDGRVPGEIEKQRVLSAIELLGETGDRFWTPCCPVRGSLDAQVESLLLDDVRDVEREEKDAAGSAAEIDSGPIAFAVDDGFLWDKKGIDHDGRIVAKRSCRFSSRFSVVGSQFSVVFFEDANHSVFFRASLKLLVSVWLEFISTLARYAAPLCLQAEFW